MSGRVVEGEGSAILPRVSVRVMGAGRVGLILWAPLDMSKVAREGIGGVRLA